MEDNIITVEELQEKLKKKDERVFILDVRPLEQREEWKIAGSAHVDAYKQLKAGEETALDLVDIPKRSTVVTVCAAGRTSLLASRLLAKKGVTAFSLEGGMKAWNFAWNKAVVQVPEGPRVVQIRRMAKGVLSYLAGSAGEAVVIDAALDPKVYIEEARRSGWKIKYVMDTHIHADYVSRTKELAEAAGAKHLMISSAEVGFDFIHIQPGETIRFGKSSLEFLHTPGHTWESTTFKLDNCSVFTGDTLFVDGIGRPDLKAAQSEAVERAKSLYKSLSYLFSLEPSLSVFPAHTSDTIAFDEKPITDSLGNIRQRITQTELTESEFVDFALSKIPPTPPNYQTIADINKKGVREGHELAELEAGGNHCAIA